MKKLNKSLQKLVPVLPALLLMLVLALGCSNFEAPTMSPNAEPELGLWNPKAGDEIVPGREVPLLNEPRGGMHTDGGVLAQPLPVSATIGREGGDLRLGFHVLHIPAGAVDREVTFTMSSASLTGVAVDCGPSPFRFLMPVELTLSYAGTQYENSDRQSSLQIFYMANLLNCTPLPSRVDVDRKTVTAQLDHFSRYIIG
jgi:hypothetical protein